MTAVVSSRFDINQASRIRLALEDKARQLDCMVPVSFPNDSGASFDFAGQELVLLKSNALYWPNERALLVADLHLEKGSWYAQRGQMLPPYDSRETLERIADSVKQTGARRVITLGDNFHDDEGALRLDPYAAGMLESLTRALDWVWITGNHDQQMRRAFGAMLADELEMNGIIFRHEAKRGETKAELSGHFHPKMRLRVRDRHISRPCGVFSRSEGSGDRLILPAFGAYTGGMDAGSKEIIEALSPASRIDAVLATNSKLLSFPLYRKAA